MKREMVLCLMLVVSLVPVSAESANIKEEKVRFGTQWLNGILCIPEKTPAPAIIICQSMGSNMFLSLSMAELFCRMGYNALVFDPRGFQSSGRRFTFESAVEDTISAVDFLQSRDEVIKDDIGILGVSLGAAVAIQAAARDERIKTVVLVGLPVDFKETVSKFPNYFVEQSEGDIFDIIPVSFISKIISKLIDMPPLIIQSLLYVPALCCNPTELCGIPYIGIPCWLVCCGIQVSFDSWGLYLYNNPSFSFLSLARMYREVLDYNVSHYIEKIEPREILLVHGMQDALIDVNEIKELASTYENVDLVLYEGGHSSGVGEETFTPIIRFFSENLNGGRVGENESFRV